MLGVNAGARVAVWHGRIDIHPKGIDTLVDAWCRVRITSPSLRTLLLLGTGPGASWLRHRIDALGLDDVWWRDEYVLDRDVIGTYLSAADVFVLPSRHEGMPLVALEAMEAGLPVVATRVIGSAEVVDDGVTGALVRPGDPVALGAAVAGLLADPALRRRQGTAGRRRYEARFTRARMAADTAAVYESVLAAAEVAA